MDTQTEAQIFLANQRGLSQTDFLRSYHTFNFGPYVAEGREPFGPLHLLNDETLRAGASLTLQVEQPTDVWLLPLAGGLEYSYSVGLATEAPAAGAPVSDFLEPGQLGVLSLPAGGRYTVSNPYETESINFLQLWLAKPHHAGAPVVDQIRFDPGTKNTLLSFFGIAASEPDGAPVNRGFIGQYTGREDGTYAVPKPAEGSVNRVFVVVLQGVFEVANRLLHEKDGLALQYRQADVVEFEALSNDAILLLLDMPANP